MAAFTPQELKAMQERPPERKVNVTISKLLELCIHVNYKIAVAFSGGKDSTVLLDIAARFWAGEKEQHGGAPLVVVFANTSNEFTGMEAFVKWYCGYIEEKHGITIDLHIVRGEDTYYKVVANKGYPVGSKFIARQVRDVQKWLKSAGVEWDAIKNSLNDGITSANFLRSLGASHTVVLYLTGVKSDNTTTKFSKLSKRWYPLITAPFEVSPECCTILKKAPMKAIQKELGLSPVIAEMAADGRTRRNAYLKTGCNAFKNDKAISKPMGFWLEADVLWYIQHYNLPHFFVYGELERLENGDLHFTGEDRTGCKLCLFGCQFKSRKDQFIRLKQLEPQTIAYAFKPLKEKGLGYCEIIEFVNQYCGCNINLPRSAEPQQRFF